MAETTINISDRIRTGLINLIKAESWFANNYTRNGITQVYEEPFESVTISNYPAISLYDFTSIDFTQEQFIIPSREQFILEVAYQSDCWRNAKVNVSKDLLSARLTLRNWKIQDPTTNDLMSIIRDLTIISVKPIGAVEDRSRMWTYIAELSFYVDYEEGFYPDDGLN